MTLQGHTDWVRDVAFAPSIGMPKTYLASGSQVDPLKFRANTRINESSYGHKMVLGNHGRSK